MERPPRTLGGGPGGQVDQLGAPPAGRRRPGSPTRRASPVRAAARRSSRRRHRPPGRPGAAPATAPGRLMHATRERADRECAARSGRVCPAHGRPAAWPAASSANTQSAGAPDGRPRRGDGRRPARPPAAHRSSRRASDGDVGPPGGQQFEVVGDRRQPEDARPALPGALPGHLPGDPRRLGDAARRGREDHDDARPRGWPRPRPADRARTATVGPVRVEPGAAVATDQEPGHRRPVGPHAGRRSRRPACPSSTSTTPGGRTAPDTVTRVVPGASCGPERPEPRRPVPGDEGHLGQRLGVVDQHGAAPEPAAGRTCRPAGPVGRHRRSSQATSADSSPVTYRAGGRRRDTARPTPAGRRRSATARWRARAVASRSSATHTTTSRAPDEGGGDLGAVEDEVGRPGQQRPVLGAGRLALHGVHHHDGTPARPAWPRPTWRRPGTRRRPGR